MCIYALKKLYQIIIAWTKTMFLCFLDAHKAFDSVNHAKLFHKYYYKRCTTLYT